MLPAIVVGCDVAESKEAILRALLPREAPDWLWLVSQQAGGLAMSYPTLLGAVLRLEPNLGAAVERGNFVIRGLRAMAEDPDMELIRRNYPTLTDLVLTHGGQYPPASIAKLQAFLSGPLVLPRLERGIEACVRFEEHNLLEYFEGWKMLHHEVPQGGVRKIYSVDDGIVHIDESNVSDLRLVDRGAFGDHQLRVLRELGVALPENQGPSAFLLWENSD